MICYLARGLFPSSHHRLAQLGELGAQALAAHVAGEGLLQPPR
jgi:hypothetical protein